MRGAILLVPALFGDGITPAEFKKLHRELIPSADSKWQTVAWRVDLLEARAEAIQSGKPLFMWGMNGHPLGCT